MARATAATRGSRVSDRAWSDWNADTLPDHRKPTGGVFNLRGGLRRARGDAHTLGDELADTAGDAASSLGGRLGAGNFGAAVLGAAVGLMGLILLDLVLSDRGSAGVGNLLGTVGRGVGRIVDPTDPFFRAPGAGGSARRSLDDGQGETEPTSSSYVQPSTRLVSPLAVPFGTGSEFLTPDGREGVPNGQGGYVHGGKDWFAPAGTRIVAPVTGRVVEVTPSRGMSGQVFGGVVKVQDSRTGLVFVFRHVNPRIGQGSTVNAGEPIATVSPWTGGRTHAHVEVWKSLTGGYKLSNLLDPIRVFAGVNPVGKAA